MSRTYRKHAESFEASHRWLIEEIYSGLARWYTPNKYLTKKEIENSKRELEVYRYKYKTQTAKYYDYGLPRDFRNLVNRKRRAVDKRELYKEVTFNDYIGNYDLWNCTSSNAWGFW